jgi:hypothetical protein
MTADRVHPATNRAYGSTRREVLDEVARRGKTTGPQPRKHLIEWEDIGCLRKLDCARYDDCLGEMAVVGCRSWQCPLKCAWCVMAPPDEVPYRTDEPYYTDAGDGRTGRAGEGE